MPDELLVVGVMFIVVLMWIPALAAAAFARPRMQDYLDRRGVPPAFSAGGATAVALMTLGAWMPVYMLGMFAFFAMTEALLG